MERVVGELSMSLDGIVADAADGVAEVFAYVGAVRSRFRPRTPSSCFGCETQARVSGSCDVWTDGAHWPNAPGRCAR
jgi:hypothetical protein